MKALVLKDYHKFMIEEFAVPGCGPDEALVKIKACAICGSDVHGIDGSTGRRIPPIIMGHEASGIIEKVGANVHNFQPGARVTFDSTIYCGRCYFCRRGKINLCDHRKVLGVSCDDYRLHGALAEYVTLPSHIIYSLPDSVSFEQAAMIEPLSIAFHALRRSSVSLNETVVVVGVGMIGLLVVQLLKLVGCRQIIAVDLVQEKLNLARKFGATVGLKADQVDVPTEIYKLTEGRGADLAFEVVGITSTVQSAIASLRKGGSLILVGNLKPSVDLPLQTIVTRQLSLNGSCASSGEYPDCLELIASGKVDVDTFISATAPLADGEAWFKRLYAGEPGLMKVILKP